MAMIPDTFDVTTTEPVPFARLVRVEVRKLRDTRSGFWLLVCTLGLGVVADVIALIVVAVKGTPSTFGDFTAVFAFVSSILLPVLGILLVTSEWSQRTGMVTFTLESHRARVIAAKAVAGLLLTLTTIVTAIVAGLVCNLVFGLVQGPLDWAFSWRGLGAFALNQVFSMLGGFALACLLLNSPAAIVAFFVYKWVLPTLFAIGAALMAWFDSIVDWIDFEAAAARLYDGPLGAERWAQLGVSGLLWLALPLGVGLWRILRAEVK